MAGRFVVFLVATPSHHAHHTIGSLPIPDHTTLATLKGDQVEQSVPRSRMTGLSQTLTNVALRLNELEPRIAATFVWKGGL